MAGRVCTVPLVFFQQQDDFSHAYWSRTMVNKSTDHGNDVMVASHFAVKLLAHDSWLHLSFEHFDIFSMVDKSIEIVVYLLNGAERRVLL